VKANRGGSRFIRWFLMLLLFMGIGLARRAEAQDTDEPARPKVPAEAPSADAGVATEPPPPAAGQPLPQTDGGTPVEPPPTATEAPPDPDDPNAPKPKKKKKKDGEDRFRIGGLDISGRIHLRADLEQNRLILVDPSGVPRSTEINSFDFGVPLARLRFRYRPPSHKWLSAELEADLADRNPIRDAFAQVQSDNFTARIGRFRMPLSGLLTASPWTLPTVRRGYLHDVLVDRLDVGGRRPGALFAWEPAGVVRSKFSIGAFQASTLISESPTERDTDLLDRANLRSQSLLARAQVGFGGLDFGTYYEHRVGSPAPTRTHYYWTAGADLTGDWLFGNGGLRFWLDLIAGASWYEHRMKVADGKDATFVMARALVGYRFGGIARDAFYVEPYGLFGVLDPDMEVVDDRTWEASLGVNVGLWQRARVALQGDVNKGQRNFPIGYFVGPPPDRMALLFLTAVAF
jgi:hypothetical protein